MHNTTAIGIDLGGTRVKGVVVDQLVSIIHPHYTQIQSDNWKQAIMDTVLALQRAVPGDHLLGISAPGIPSEDNSCIRYMPGRLQGLEGFVWGDVFGGPTWVANDAIAAMAAEARFGAAKGYRHGIMLTLGTGVGGAILIDGKIYTGAFQKGGHLGHITLQYNGEKDITGTPGSLEDAIGNCTILQRSGGRYGRPMHCSPMCRKETR
jgi:glucokinase